MRVQEGCKNLQKTAKGCKRLQEASDELHRHGRSHRSRLTESEGNKMGEGAKKCDAFKKDNASSTAWMMCQAHWCLENFRRRWTDKRWAADELRRHFRWKFSTLKNLDSRHVPRDYDDQLNSTEVQTEWQLWFRRLLRLIQQTRFVAGSSSDEVHLMRQRVSCHQFQISEFRRTQKNSERTTRKNPGRKPKTSTARQTIDMLKCLRNGSFEGSIWKKLYLKINQKEH